MKARVYKVGLDWCADLGTSRVWCSDWEAAMQAAWGMVMYPEVCS